MNLVSIGASFGVIVWIFQDGPPGRPARLQSTGFIEPSNMILMLAVLFGLATDYEVFLLSRVREEWDRTGDNTTAVAAGLQRTGRIITAAALLLDRRGGRLRHRRDVPVIKLIGVGMIVAIVVDATLVRALLVPATMRLLGRWNWWAPGHWRSSTGATASTSRSRCPPPSRRRFPSPPDPAPAGRAATGSPDGSPRSRPARSRGTGTTTARPPPPRRFRRTPRTARRDPAAVRRTARTRAGSRKGSRR